MSIILFILGLVTLIAGLLSIAKITSVGVKYLELSRIHTLPYVSQLPSAWVYVILGLLLLVIAYAITRKK